MVFFSKSEQFFIAGCYQGFICSHGVFSVFQRGGNKLECGMDAAHDFNNGIDLRIVYDVINGFSKTAFDLVIHNQ